MTKIYLHINVIQKKLKDQAILKTFYVKESSFLIAREKFSNKSQEPDCLST